jgi:hypothetical protein
MSYPYPRRQLRKIADAGPRQRDQTPNVLSAVTVGPSREQRLWSEEVARVLATASTLHPAARRAVRATLHSLASDPSTDPAILADVVALLAATAVRRPEKSAIPRARAAGVEHQVRGRGIWGGGRGTPVGCVSAPTQ